MPEGDTIFVAARTLGRALGGREVTAYSSTIPAAQADDIAGRSIVRVEPRGKNLLMHFDDGRVLHSHMLMSGSWHVYKPGEAWQRPTSQAKVIIETDAYVAVCFNARMISLMSPRGALRDRQLATLGPDMLADDWDRAAILARLRARGDLPIGVALLHQRLVSGIGNVYKSEILYDCRVDPFVATDRIDDETLGRIVDTARRMMLANLEGKGRRTRPISEGRGKFYVYGRSGERCYACKGFIRMRRQGDMGRSTYYCPTCQGTSV